MTTSRRATSLYLCGFMHVVLPKTMRRFHASTGILSIRYSHKPVLNSPGIFDCSLVCTGRLGFRKKRQISSIERSTDEHRNTSVVLQPHLNHIVVFALVADQGFAAYELSVFLSDIPSEFPTLSAIFCPFILPAFLQGDIAQQDLSALQHHAILEDCCEPEIVVLGSTLHSLPYA
jgi:hypothetical protein